MTHQVVCEAPHLGVLQQNPADNGHFFVEFGIVLLMSAAFPILLQNS